LGEWLLILIITLVVYSFILFFVIKNAIDNSVALKKIESLLDELVKDSK